MSKRILLIQGHPDGGHQHLCDTLEHAYEAGARSAGHEVRRCGVAGLSFPLLRSQEEWEHGQLPQDLHSVQQDILWSQHIVFFYPLWLGDMPALLKGLLEQVARPGFAFGAESGRKVMRKQGLRGRSARLVVTMGMLALVYRLFFRAHSLKSMKRNILQFVGIKPVSDTVVGMVGDIGEDKARRWRARMDRLGRPAA